MSLNKEAVEKARRLCQHVISQQIIQEEPYFVWDYVEPEQPLSDQEIIGVTCNIRRRRGFFDNRCVFTARSLDCPADENVGEAVKRLGCP